MNSRAQMSRRMPEIYSLRFGTIDIRESGARYYSGDVRKHNGDRSREIMKAMCVAFVKLN